MKLSTLLLAILALVNQCWHLSCSEIEKIDDLVAITRSRIQNASAAFVKDGHRFSYSHSPVDLLYLTIVEDGLFPIIKDYVAKLNKEPEFYFERYIADYEESTIVAFNGWNSTTGTEKLSLIHRNPLWAHRMIWRLVTDFPQIKNALLSSEDSEILTAYGKIVPKTIVWPTQTDLNNSMDNLLTLHFVYDLYLAEFSNGIIADVVTNASLSAIHCFEISNYALRTLKYTLAFEWLEIAEKKRLNIRGHPILDYLEKTDVSELLEDIITKHDTAWLEEAPHFYNLYSYYYKIDSEYPLHRQTRQLQFQYKSKGDGVENVSYNDITAFSTLCKGGNLQSEKEKSELYCWHESKIHPAWYINPQKMELYSKNPYLFQVYDFVGDEFMKYLKKKATPRLERSMVTHGHNGANGSSTAVDENQSKIYSETRTSMFAWFLEKDYPDKLSVLSKRIGYLTALSASWPEVFTSSSIQVSTYATGGHFNLHIDSLKSTPLFNELQEKNIGDRTATFMLYLNDVELGGNTAFTSIGVAVRPVKGSGVFWYDNLRNGEEDYRAWHGGCPVLIGEKWVGNKWIYNNLNIFKRPCTLNKDE